MLCQKLDAALVTAVQGAPLETPHEVVILFADTAALTAVADLAATFYPMQALPMAGAILTGSRIMEMANWPEIYSISLNSPLEYFLADSVPLVQADQVWEQNGEIGGNVTVAVVDSGIDATHPDLPFGETVIQNVKVLPFQASLENQLQTDTTSGHGTHVAGTIGGTGAFSDGHYRGVAPGVKLVGLGAGEGLFILTAVQAYDWILQNHAEYNIRIISNSWGSSGGEINVRNPIVLASYEAYKLGMLSVFAAGNSGGYDILNPYSLPPWLLSVAAGKKDGSLADFSSRGKEGDYFKYPDIVAPGVDIYAARSSSIGATGLDPWPNPVNPLWTVHYTVMSGTSMATPHVSGAAALLLSHNPNLSPDEVMDLLTAHASPMPGYMLHEAGFGYMGVLASYEASLNLSGNLAEFLAGDQGFIVFSVAQGDGTPVSGAGANFHVIYSDRNGQVIRVDNNVNDRGGGEYSSSFNINNSWAGLPGPVMVSFAWGGEGSLRAVPTGFSLNHLAITLNTPHEQYEPGDLVQFNGNVAQVNTVTTGDISQSPLTGALVTLHLLDKEGNSLASTQAQTNLQGNYSGALPAPAISAGRTTLVAEVSYQDSAILTGPNEWYGRAERALHFPGNSALNCRFTPHPSSGRATSPTLKPPSTTPTARPTLSRPPCRCRTPRDGYCSGGRWTTSSKATTIAGPWCAAISCAAWLPGR
jgi:subtilisin family serine protease